MKKPKPLQTLNPPSLSQLKSPKKPPLTPTTKKKPLKQSQSLKSKQLPNKLRTEPQDYIIINDNIYSANTFTERNNYQQFLHKVKKEKQVERKSFLVKSQFNEETQLKKNREHPNKNLLWKQLSPQDFIQTMNLDQKKQIFLKLQQEIRAANSAALPIKIPQSSHNSQPCSTLSFENGLSERKRLDSERERKEKFSVLQEKLQNYKMQLMFKWQGQIDKLQEMCRKGKISEQQKQTKTTIIQKLKDHKLKILDCTKTLFEKILKQQQYEQQHTEQKTNKIESILKSLHSFPSLDNLDSHYAENEPNIDHLKVKEPQEELPDFSPHKNLVFDSSPLEIVEDNQHQTFLNDFRDNPWDRSNSKSTQDLKSPLNFLNNSPEKVRFAQYDDPAQSHIHQNTHYPSNPLFSQSHQATQSSITNSLNKPLFGDGGEKISLKLDLRLDEVVFGQDEYRQCEKEEQTQAKIEFNSNLQNHVHANSSQIVSSLTFTKTFNTDQFTLQKPQESYLKAEQQDPPHEPIINQAPPPISPSKVQKISISKISVSSPPKLQPEDDLACKQQPAEKITINIPMILSRQKMQTLAFEQNRAFRQHLDNHIAFQMGCIELECPDPSLPSSFHFTTLVDINTYIVGFYEFMMKKYMGSLVDNLNIPYGKSAIDKLFSLQTEGFVIEESYNEMNNILSQSHFIEYQREIMFTMRKCTEYESAHNRAVFDAFTKCINVYRPYFDLEGEVFPWIVSEKGITFYEITEDNIEEVFEKSKIKVLESCTALCGLQPPSEIKNDEQSGVMNQKKEENLLKMIKTEVLEQFEEWKIRFVNFDCLVRMLVADRIYADVLNEILGELSTIQEAKASL